MEDMVSKLKKPRRVMLLVKAGAAVDAFIDKLVKPLFLYQLKYYLQMFAICSNYGIFNFIGFLKLH